MAWEILFSWPTCPAWEILLGRTRPTRRLFLAHFTSIILQLYGKLPSRRFFSGPLSRGKVTLGARFRPCSRHRGHGNTCCNSPQRRGEHRYLHGNQIDGPIPTEIGMLSELQTLRVPPASPTPGAARDRPSASQVPRRQRDHRPDPARDRPAHGAAVPASSPRVPDARRAARPPLDVAGTSTTT